MSDDGDTVIVAEDVQATYWELSEKQDRTATGQASSSCVPANTIACRCLWTEKGRKRRKPYPVACIGIPGEMPPCRYGKGIRPWCNGYNGRVALPTEGRKVGPFTR